MIPFDANTQIEQANQLLNECLNDTPPMPETVMLSLLSKLGETHEENELCIPVETFTAWSITDRRRLIREAIAKLGSPLKVALKDNAQTLAFFNAYSLLASKQKGPKP